MHVGDRKPHEKGSGKASWDEVSGGKMERTGFPGRAKGRTARPTPETTGS